MMRKFIAVWLLAIIAISLFAQTQFSLVGVPGAEIDYQTTHAGYVMTGDTEAVFEGSVSGGGTFTYDLNDGTGPHTISRTIYGTISDGIMGDSNGAHDVAFGFLKWKNVNFATPSNTWAEGINAMTSFGGGGNKDAPVGWHGMSTSGQADQNYTWHPSRCTSRGGYIFCQVQRAVNTSAGDVTLLVNPPGDLGLHWCNPADVAANGGVCDSSVWHSNGSAPDCGAAMAGDPCPNAAYLDATHSSVMWKNPSPFDGSTQTMGNLNWVEYGPDGTGTGPDGSSTYTYAIGGYAGMYFLHRVPTAVIRHLDPADWEHFDCAVTKANVVPNISDSSCWVSGFATIHSFRPTFLDASGNTATFANQLGQVLSSIQYVSSAKIYLMMSNVYYTGNQWPTTIATGPTPLGPWTVTSHWNGAQWTSGNAANDGIPSLFAPMMTVSGNTIQLPYMYSNRLVDNNNGSPYIRQLTLTLKHPPPDNGSFNNTVTGEQFTAPVLTNPVPMVGAITSSPGQWVANFYPSGQYQNLAGVVYANIDSPVGNTYCPATASNSSVPTLGPLGMAFLNVASAFGRCVTNNNFPFSGDSAYTQTTVFTQTTGTTGCLWNTGSYNNAAGAITLCVASNGTISLYNAGDQVTSTAAGAVPVNGTTHSITVVKSATGGDSNLNFFVDGTYICGGTLGTRTACPTVATHTMNLVASPLRFGVYGTASSGACTSGSCAWANQFAGTIHHWNIKPVASDEAKSDITALKLQQARRGVVLP